MDQDNKEQRKTNNNDSSDDDDDCEIEEELEGGNDSLNLHNAAVLERLPQLTSTPGARSQKVDSPLLLNSSGVEDTNLRPPSSSRSNHRPSDVVVNHLERKHSQSEKTKSISVAPEVREGERKHRSQKYSNAPETHAEDLVVLSFSSSAGQSA